MNKTLGASGGNRRQPEPAKSARAVHAAVGYRSLAGVASGKTGCAMPFGEYQPCYRLNRFLVVGLAKEVVGSRAFTGSPTLCAGSNIIMVEQDSNTSERNSGESPRILRRQYQDPAFRHERVFETMALSCGKMSPTEFQCKIRPHTS